ncbi:MAG: hypothetical protein ACRENX_08565 [Candidatus Dormibacteria bacterium]
MPVNAPLGRRSRQANRKMVRRVRPLLVPLIGEPAFRCCVRVQYFARYLVAPLVVGVAAVVAAAFSRSAVQLALVGVWGLCCLYCLITFPLLLMWMRRSRRLASRKLSDDFGYPIRIRGGGQLSVESWRQGVERAMLRSHQKSTRAERFRE